MATKNTTTKKTSTAKKPTTARKSASKSTAAKRSSSRSRLSLASQIGLRPEETDFMTFRITRQTVYWLVLGLVVILFTVWLMKLQMDIQSLYDQIDASAASMTEL